MDRKIGESTITGPGFTLYPGEQATAILTQADVDKVVRDGGHLEVSTFRIDPAPGLANALLRLHHRLFGSKKAVTTTV